MEIDGAVCVVTGASSGIGAATARLLNERGARVVLAARRSERLEALAAELPGSLAVATDVTVPEQLERLVARALDAHGRIDVFVNNAGQGLHVPIEELDPVDLRAVFELNVIAPLVGMRTVAPYMRSRSAGSIVNVSSATSLRVFPGLGGYSATKAALNMISQVARLELAGSGVCGVGRVSLGDRDRVSRPSPGRSHAQRGSQHPSRLSRARGRGCRLRHRHRRGSRARR